ncbi:Crp/Fnr family transcriptional regulator [Pararoseomonas indoligenes]|uniref:Crp/Fnr family transcriptional regulator n=1 Tax=Roseomonas indoligenes TaxID=2820811 RepID=A0A940N245_9PROT|nr:Crp/Fnr family transcriptional regulator [Pararoseomonas indoligenes]MBP0495345.1 Crp/Fnr family transcriptional regulator [Pararoseomonas indoligenes]
MSIAPQIRSFSHGDLLARRLGGLMPLGPLDMLLLDGLGRHVRSSPAGEEIGEHGAPLRARLIRSGWAGAVRTLEDGRRQIFRLLLPGDCIGTSTTPSALAVSTTLALTPVETVELEPVMTALREDPDRHAALATAFALGTAQAEAGLLDHLMRLGRQTALERTAHLLLELRDRLAAVGMTGRTSFPLPLTQEILADTLGLSTVHMNRTLQELRRLRLLRLDKGQAELLDPTRLADLGNYAPPRVSTLCPPELTGRIWA